MGQSTAKSIRAYIQILNYIKNHFYQRKYETGMIRISNNLATFNHKLNADLNMPLHAMPKERGMVKNIMHG